MQTMDLHGPYLPPKEFLPDDYDSRHFFSYFDFLNLAAKGVLRTERFRPYLENLRQRYAAELRFTDSELGQLVDHLRTSGRWDEAMIWIVSDHGEAFGEHDHAGHALHLITSLIHVPLIFKPPRALGLAPEVVDTAVSIYDIVPTTLSVLGASVPLGLFGVPLVSPGGELVVPLDRLVIADGSFSRGRRNFTSIQGDWKLDITLPREEGGAALERRLFDLDADPEESEDLLVRHPDIARRLEVAVRERVRAERRLSLESQEDDIDPVMRERLRSLGYVE
jgi:arylsulfatase A-like enzyme